LQPQKAQPKLGLLSWLPSQPSETETETQTLVHKTVDVDTQVHTTQADVGDKELSKRIADLERRNAALSEKNREVLASNVQLNDALKDARVRFLS